MTVRNWGVFALHHGDCLDVLRGMADASVDAVVTDPPYGLGFMGKAWDSFTAADMPMRRSGPQDAVNAGMSRQGGRQRAGADYQRRQVADMHAFQAWCEEWAVECLRVLKPGGHLLAFGGTRTYHRLAAAIEDAGFDVRDQIGWAFGSGFPKSHNGPWGGTALKPAWEPICVARKSLVGTVEANWHEHGTGALNIDGCRVPTTDDLNGGAYSGGSKDPANASSYATGVHAGEFVQPVGRWPANIIHDGSDEVLAAFPQAPGQQGGSAARFFYCAKASKKDRDEGCEGLPQRVIGTWGGDDDDLSPGKKSTVPKGNTHPTVKPTDLMRYLCRLVTPAGGVVLDPFTGSGSTGKAAVLEGFRFVGIEREAAYVDIAERRIATAVFGPCAFGDAAA